MKINGRADFFLSRGFRSLTFVTLEGPSGTAVDVELYDLGSTENALGAFAAEKPPETKAASGGGTSWYVARNALFLARGASYVRAIGSDESPAVLAQLETLAQGVRGRDRRRREALDRRALRRRARPPARSPPVRRGERLLLRLREERHVGHPRRRRDRALRPPGGRRGEGEGARGEVRRRVPLLRREGRGRRRLLGQGPLPLDVLADGRRRDDGRRRPRRPGPGEGGRGPREAREGRPRPSARRREEGRGGSACRSEADGRRV